MVDVHKKGEPYRATALLSSLCSTGISLKMTSTTQPTQDLLHKNDVVSWVTALYPSHTRSIILLTFPEQVQNTVVLRPFIGKACPHQSNTHYYCINRQGA